MEPVIYVNQFQLNHMEIIPLISPNEIHIWYLSDLESFSVDALLGLLSPWEREKYLGFRTPERHLHFLLGHGILHELLMAYLRCSNEEIQLIVGSQGRLTMKPDFHGTVLDFNISHSGHYVVLALSKEYQVGVDIQMDTLPKNMDRLAKRALHPSEYAHYQKASEEQRATLFYQYWTIKEAYIKATGQGLSCPTDSFQIKSKNFINTQTPLQIYDAQGNPTPWTAHPLLAPNGYHTTLAYRHTHI